MVGMLLIVSAITLLLPSCGDLIEYSPYDADVKTTNQNNVNISRILNAPLPADSLIIAVISDTHANHTNLNDAIKFINRLTDISFVVINGDITNWGLAKEYKDFYSDISKLKVPSITVIGNHDYLSNGAIIYNRLFGAPNFSFVFGNQKIVVFDNVVWEKGNHSPDFDWLESKLPHDENQTSILFTHIHPWDPQLENGYAERMLSIIEKNKVLINVFGHGSNPRFEVMNKRQYLVVPKIAVRAMTRLSIASDTAVFKIIKF